MGFAGVREERHQTDPKAVHLSNWKYVRLKHGIYSYGNFIAATSHLQLISVWSIQTQDLLHISSILEIGQINILERGK